MACGCVVVATPVGGVPDVVIDGETGVLLFDRKPEEASKLLLKLLNNPRGMKTISKNAYTYVKNEYSFDKVHQRWQGIINLVEKADKYVMRQQTREI